MSSRSIGARLVRVLRSTVVAALLATTGAALAPGVSAASPPSHARAATERAAARPCHPPRRTVLAATEDVVVYAKVPAQGAFPTYYACRWGSRQRVRIAEVADPDESFTQASVAGRFVAFSSSTCPKIDVAGCTGSVRVVDVARRRIRGTWRLPDASRSADGVVLASSGAAVWTHTVYPQYDPENREASGVQSLYTMAPNGRVSTLGTGIRVEPGSLTLGRAPSVARPAGYLGVGAPIAYWFEAGAPRSALLP